MSAALFEALHPSRWPSRRHRPARPLRSWLNRHFSAAVQTLAAWRARARARNALLRADARMLADLGISRAEAHFRALNDRLD
ncbi:MAG TPA: DUF1127 domain-containing protein [Acetobacteraceae bacterium]|jgi:uncharacterized protein YjiS (DUF1127 family)|nr:DUF1127 domain-containing protein [Acetobacteraceae bacterium]